MDLLEKFSAVEVKPTDCMTETDRQFCDHQQELYQDAVESFYQIAALWCWVLSRLRRNRQQWSYYKNLRQWKSRQTTA